MEIDQIYHGDCLELMKEIPDNSIDMILCDLPYGVLGKNNHNTKWDVIIPFEPLWEQYARITKDNAAIVLFAQGMFTANLMASNPKLWRYNLIWDKCGVSDFLNANRKPLASHEDICVFYKKQPIYNPQMVKCLPHQRNHSNGVIGSIPPKNNCYGVFNVVPSRIVDDKYPRSIISMSKNSVEDKKYHPTQKPIALLRWLIATYTNMGKVILDNCMGSGSTIVAAIKEKRHFIGIEKDDNYYNIAMKRIKEAKQQLTLF